MRRKHTTRGLAVAAVLAAAAAAGLGVAPPGTAAVAVSELPGECPPVMPVSELERGMIGTGLSVVQGRDPETFDVEILGVLEDALAPGRDIVIADLSGPVIDGAGGLWAGASGSPVYVADPDSGDQELIGAVAWGLAWGQSSLAGLTPAEDMVDLLDPSLGVTGLAASRTIPLPRRLAARMAASAGLATSSVRSLSRLKIPVSFSGVAPGRLDRVQAAIERQNLPLIAYAGAGASAASGGPTAELAAGESFAAALSLGDITAAAVGTTTFICYGQAVAFGHPFFFNGDTTLAARAADTITIVQDPLFGSYKLANIAENAGVVTNDRLAGIVATLGDGPASTPVTSNVTDLDRSKSRSGQSDVVLPEFTGFLTFLHLLSNIDVTIDRIGPGSSEMTYSIAGTRGDGSPWELTRSTRFASRWDIAFESVWEAAIGVELLGSFSDEGVEITGVDVPQVDVKKAFEQYNLTKVLVWNGRGFVKRDVIFGHPGQTILLRAVLTPKHRTGTENVDLELRVPARARRSGFIEVFGGASAGAEIPCFFDDEECGEDGGAASFDDVLTALQKQPRSDVLVARLRLGGRTGGFRSSDRERKDAVVAGSRVIGFELVR